MLEFKLFDADNHFYEPPDAFTRHLDPAIARRAIQWATVDGKTRLLVCGKVHRFIPNPSFDPIAKPGALDEYFRGRRPRGATAKELFGELEPIADRPEYRNRAARLDVMDRQNLDAAVLLPTLGVVLEPGLLDDPEALVASYRAFNDWMHEDWGFAHRERIFATPLITLYDPDNAADEVARALDRDARFVVIVPGPVITAEGPKSPTDRVFDRFWATVNEAGLTVLLHGGDNRYSAYLADWGRQPNADGFEQSKDPLRALLSHSPTQDFLAALLAGGLFHRFPALRVASIENGCDWVFHLFDKLRKSFSLMPDAYAEDPRETFRRHVWVSPYYEDPLDQLKELVGVERMLMGSDFPHVEGLAEPASYIDDLRHFGFTAAECRKVMRENGFELARRAPTGVGS